MKKHRLGSILGEPRPLGLQSYPHAALLRVQQKDSILSQVPDSNAVLSGAIAELIKSAFISVSRKSSKAFADNWAKVFEDFEPYMKDAYQKNKFVRLLVQKDKDVDFRDVYVKSNFLCAGENVDDDELVFRIREGKNVVINGNGGAGKTFFMRHLWLSFFHADYGFTPIFIELRKLNDLTSIDVRAFIRRSISRKRELDENLFDHFCDKGSFCFILDGFDEVSVHQRDSLQKQILDFSGSFPSCRFVVSSRYEQRFSGWQNFDLYDSKPFDHPQVRQLIQKVPFDPSSKKLFLKYLDIEFYNKNRDFLSNPLLAIMMMMTFRENMDIPKRMNIFYDQAFSTLYQWHDATKAFNRHKTLDIEEFQRSFGAFCLLSYHKEKFEFSKAEIISFINDSNKVCSISHDPEEILKDYEESVNLIKQDGLNYVFIHRSFQEYFTAYAMTVMLPEKFADLIKGIRHRGNDNVLSMCFEMNRGLVIREYIKPLFEKLLNTGRLTKSKKNKFDMLEKLKMKQRIALTSSHESERSFVEMMYTDIDYEFLELLNAVERLGNFDFRSYGSSADYFDTHGTFVAIDSAIEKILMRCNDEFLIHCQDGDVKIEVLGDNHSAAEEYARSLRTHRTQFLPAFEALERRVAADIREINAWCKEEISASQKRGRTLDSILGL